MNSNNLGQNWVGVREICDLTIQNNSVNIGTGALRFVSFFGSLRNLSLWGQVGLDASWNVFNMVIQNVETHPTIDNGYGTVGMILSGGLIVGSRAARAVRSPTAT
jgi:hypothetical protein